jgi:hypothetical protein
MILALTVFVTAAQGLLPVEVSVKMSTLRVLSLTDNAYTGESEFTLLNEPLIGDQLPVLVPPVTVAESAMEGVLEQTGGMGENTMVASFLMPSRKVSVTGIQPPFPVEVRISVTVPAVISLVPGV